MSYYYVYRITNKKEGKYYIGSRSSTLKPEDDLGHIYFSSSSNKKFIDDQLKDPDNFIYEIIEIFPSYEKAVSYETELLQELDVRNDSNYYNGRSSLGFPPVNSRATKYTLSYLGNLIKLARKERGISQQELSERVNLSRGTICKIEEGNPNVSIGSVFEICFVLGIPLLGCNEKDVYNLATMLSYIHRILPDRLSSNILVDDDF